MTVYSTSALRVGVFRCPPGDALWHETNDNIGERPHVVFPGTAVGLVREGVHADRDAQRRGLLPPVRDLRAHAARRARRRLPVHRAARPRRPRRAARPRRRAQLPARPPAREPARRPAVRRGDRRRADPARDRRARAPLRPPRPPRAATAPSSPRPPRTSSSTTSPSRSPSPTWPRELHVSPFHLTRVFRERTGRTLTEYLHDLRLRAAVERLGEDSLSRIAADLGYCSASHFTDRFRASLRRPALATAQFHGSGDARRVVEPPHDQARFGPRGRPGTRGPRGCGRRLQGTGEGPLAAHGSGGQVLRVGRRAARRPRPRRRGRGARRRAGGDAVGRPGVGVGPVRPHRAGHPPLRGEDGRPERLLDRRRRRRRPRRLPRHPQRRAAPERRHRGPRLPLLRSLGPAAAHVRGRGQRRRLRRCGDERGRQPRRPQRPRRRRAASPPAAAWPTSSRAARSSCSTRSCRPTRTTPSATAPA